MNHALLFASMAGVKFTHVPYKATGQMINDNVDIRVDKVPPGAIYYAAPMPNFMRITGGIGMHEGYLPGFAASHGCIRLPSHA